MAKFFRSEAMSYMETIVPTEAARSFAFQLACMSCVSLTDVRHGPFHPSLGGRLPCFTLRVFCGTSPPPLSDELRAECLSKAVYS